LGAQKNSRNVRGCFALTDLAIHPGPLKEIGLEEFFAMLRFEQRHKLAELDYRDLLRKRGSG